jgi:uncharacterized membrane protein YesL
MGGYDQTGPGVYANEQREGPVVRFFRILAARFFTLCLCNLLFVLINLPALAVTYFVVANVMPIISPSLSPLAISASIESLGVEQATEMFTVETAASNLYWVSVFLGSFLIVGLTLIVMGPFQTAFSYMYRNFSRETPSFFWQDFIHALKTNWKQSLIVSFISFLITSVLLFNIGFYATHLDGTLSQILLGIFCVLFLLYLCMHLYVYPLIASLELPLKQIYRNAMIFAGIRLFPTIGILLLQTLIMLIIPGLMIFFGSRIGSTIAIVLYLVIVFALSHFIGNFFVWYQIEKHILPDEADEVKISVGESAQSKIETDRNDNLNDERTEATSIESKVTSEESVSGDID